MKPFHKNLSHSIITRSCLKLGFSWKKGLDQHLQLWYLWPLVRKDMVAHDAYFCNHYEPLYTRPWPTRRHDEGRNYVGSVWSKDKVRVSCPVECRPEEHKDWELC